jgi:exonuclease SbcC
MDGEPCPVCGSQEHPFPAVGGEDVPTEEALDVARLGVDEAREKRERTKGALAEHDVRSGEARAAVAALRQQLGSLADAQLDELREASMELNSGLEKVARDEKELTKAQKRREDLATLLHTAKENLIAATTSLQDVSSQADTLNGQLQAKLNELGEGDRDQATIRGQIAAIEKFIAETRARCQLAEDRTVKLQQEVDTRLGKRDEARRNALELADRVRELESRFVARLSQACFIDEADYSVARMSVEDLERNERELKTYREKEATATTELSQAEKACLGLSRPDVDSLSGVRSAADAAVTALSAERGGVASKLAAVRQAISAIEAYRKESEEQERRLKIVGNLANLAAGNNPKRITLQRFVLASLFEEVALAASERLSRMSRGRYHLRRSESVDDARKGAGLDLEVTDDFTGYHRPASTLSGGETFLASLSLALGLSDVVLARAEGAISIPCSSMKGSVPLTRKRWTSPWIRWCG